jgi:hypothetical protein
MVKCIQKVTNQYSPGGNFVPGSGPYIECHIRLYSEVETTRDNRCLDNPVEPLWFGDLTNISKSRLPGMKLRPC